MLEKGENKEYLPIEGLAAFREATLNLLLGDKNPAVKEARAPRAAEPQLSRRNLSLLLALCCLLLHGPQSSDTDSDSAEVSPDMPHVGPGQLIRAGPHKPAAPKRSIPCSAQRCAVRVRH